MSNKLLIDGKSLTLDKIEFFLHKNPDITISKTLFQNKKIKSI